MLTFPRESPDPFKGVQSPASLSSADFADSLAELYSSSELSRARLAACCRAPLPDLLNWIRKEGPEDFSVKGLWAWTESIKGRAGSFGVSQAVSLISSLPAPALASTFGKELLVWAFLNSSSDQTAHPGIVTELEVLGVGSQDLEFAARTAWSLPGGPRRIEQILAQYTVCRALRSGFTGRNDLAATLADYGSATAPFKPEHAVRYALEPQLLSGHTAAETGRGRHFDWCRRTFPGAEGDRKYEIFMDSPTGLMLTHRGQPCALAAFFARDERALFVNQLQGCRAHMVQDDFRDKTDEDGNRVMIGQRGLVRIRHVELMIGFVEDYARALGFTSLVIQGACNNRWVSILDDRGLPHLSQQAAEAIYDKIPAREGFVRDGSGNWVRSISDVRRPVESC